MFRRINNFTKTFSNRRMFSLQNNNIPVNNDKRNLILGGVAITGMICYASVYHAGIGLVKHFFFEDPDFKKDIHNMLKKTLTEKQIKNLDKNINEGKTEEQKTEFYNILSSINKQIEQAKATGRPLYIDIHIKNKKEESNTQPTNT